MGGITTSERPAVKPVSMSEAETEVRNSGFVKSYGIMIALRWQWRPLPLGNGSRLVGAERVERSSRVDDAMSVAPPLLKLDLDSLLSELFYSTQQRENPSEARFRRFR